MTDTSHQSPNRAIATGTLHPATLDRIPAFRAQRERCSDGNVIGTPRTPRGGATAAMAIGPFSAFPLPGRSQMYGLTD